MRIGSLASPHWLRRRSFTLVEALCVVAILGLVSAVLAGGLLGTSDGAAWARAEAEVRRVDRLARLAARAGGPVVIRIDATKGDRLLAASPSGEVLALGLLPDGFDVAFDPARPDGRLEVDSAGRSIDAAYVLSRSGRRVRLDVLGATGQLVEAPREDGP